MNTRILTLLAAAVLLTGCTRPVAEEQPVVSQPTTQSATQPATQPAGPVAAPAPQTFFLKMGDVDVSAVLPRPFDRASPMTKAEADLLLAIRAEATEAAKKRMEAEEKMTPFTFGEAMGERGEGFTPAKYPRTAALFKRIDNDAYHVAISPAKETYNRLRPPLQDPRVKPLLKHSDSNGYPSGHATLGMVWSRVLGELAPGSKDALRDRARLVALDRVIAGVHYPTDVCAGMALGDAIADALLKNEKFKQELEAVRKAEWAAP
ncbi:MAG TPA: phosphatase PAP2 family protein [Phycisphaerales bacterium]|nr:phosphatase PAP2 family protein [Phycisphaerales bacterium]